MKIVNRRKEIKILLFWYEENKRELPWREDRDPYKIWISEVMLQQTTAQYVVPYFKRFIQRYSSVGSLAKASQKSVLQLWSGLGYYSRAQNLLKTARQIFKNQTFPISYKDWECFSGIGSYTARAISSQAFGEKVGVLDGNTIRLFSRKEGLEIKWWTAEGKRHLQKLADELVKFGESGSINQALMELGATICKPKNPSCFLCPWKKSCKAYKENLVFKLPLVRQRPLKEIWKWEPYIYQFKDQNNRLKIALVKNDYAPFLKNYFIFPGKVKKLIQKPKRFDFSHTITHRNIYIQVRRSFFKGVKRLSKYPLDKKDFLEALYEFKKVKWISKEDIKKENPSSLVQKTLQFF